MKRIELESRIWGIIEEPSFSDKTRVNLIDDLIKDYCSLDQNSDLFDAWGDATNFALNHDNTIDNSLAIAQLEKNLS